MRMSRSEAVNGPYGKITTYIAGEEMVVGVRLLTVCGMADRLLKGWVIASALLRLRSRAGLDHRRDRRAVR